MVLSVDQPSRTLALDGMELLYLERVLTALPAGAGPERQWSPPLQALVLRVASALLESEGQPEVQVGLTEADCWAITAAADIFFEGVGTRHGVGLSIKKKVYRLLLEFDSERIAQSAIIQLAHLKHDRGETPEVRDAYPDRKKSNSNASENTASDGS